MSRDRFAQQSIIDEMTVEKQRLLSQLEALKEDRASLADQLQDVSCDFPVERVQTSEILLDTDDSFGCRLSE